jgi:transposase-like protein
MILNALVERLQRRSKHDFKGRHFEASLILQAVSWYLRYPLSSRDIEELSSNAAWRSTTAPSIAGCWPTRR